jgi:signal transduction histidine kinase
MKISYFIFSGFVIILILFSITTYINLQQAEKVNENSDWFARSTVIVRHTNRFQRNILNMVSGLRGYLFTGEQNFIQSYDSAALENEDILKELWALIPANSAQRASLKEIQKLNDLWLNDFAEPLIQAKKMAGTSDSSLLAFTRLYREKQAGGMEKKINRSLQHKFRDFSNYEYDLRDVRKATLEESIQRTRTISFYLTTFSVVTGLFIAAFLAHHISTRIVTMVKMADDIATGNYTVHIKDSGQDELSKLARSLNHMARVLDENISLLKRKNGELDQFAHIVSHDLKAPLRGIDNVVTWIQEDHHSEISSSVNEYLQIIKGRVLRAENLIRGILSYARIGKELQDQELVNVHQLVHDIRENLSIRPGITLTVQADLPEFLTERLPLHMVFTNLLVNAVKHHDKDQGEVRVYHVMKQSHYEFYVEDNGPGIAKNYHDKIFIIFQTLTERDQLESTGVGLAIVKKILDDRKQTIHLISEPGKGSIFMFTWPKPVNRI